MRAATFAMVSALAAVRGAEVATMVVDAMGSSSTSYTAAISGAYAGLGWTVSSMIVSSTGTGFVVEVPAQNGYSVAQLVEKMESCEMRVNLETSFEGAPWSLTEVAVTHACAAEEGTKACSTMLDACAGDSTGGDAGSGDSGDDDGGLSVGAIIAIVTAVLSVVAIISLVLVGAFFSMSAPRGAVAVSLSETRVMVRPSESV
jgi:hypothetical protein